MIFKLNKNISDSFWYTFGEILSKVSVFLLIPFYTRVLTQEQYGLLSVTIIITTFSTQIISYASKTAFLRIIYDYNDEEKEKLIFTIIIIITRTLLLILLLVGILNVLSYSYNFGISTYFKYVYYILGYSFFFSINNIALNILRVQRKVKSYSFFNLLKTTLELIIIIVFVNFLTDGVLGKVIGSAISMAILTIVLFTFVIRYHISFSYNKIIAKKYIHFATPLLFNNLLGWTLVSYDQMLFERNFGLKEFAILSLALQVCSIYKFSMEGILHAFNVYLYEKMNKIKDRIQEVFILFVSIFALTAVFILFFQKEIILIISTSSYIEATKVIDYYIISRFIMLLNALLAFVLLVNKKSKQVATSTLIAFFSMLVFSTILIPNFGVIGASVAATITFLVRHIYLVYYLNKTMKLYSLKSIVIITSFIVIVSLQISSELLFYHKLLLTIFMLFIVFKFNKKFLNRILT